jgi:hypothetical protein
VGNGAETAPRYRWLASLRTARSAAVAGPTGLPSPESIDRATWAIDLIPYVGIAFLWFTAALNYNVGHADNRLFTTVLTGSGVAFIVIMFMIGAIAAGELEALSRGIDPEGASRIAPGFTLNALLGSYAPRMAAVFVLALSTLGRLRKIFPPWLSILGSVTGLVLLLIPFGVRYVEYLFPAWAIVVSVYLFIADPGGKARGTAATA